MAGRLSLAVTGRFIAEKSSSYYYRRIQNGVSGCAFFSLISNKQRIDYPDKNKNQNQSTPQAIDKPAADEKQLTDNSAVSQDKDSKK